LQCTNHLERVHNIGSNGLIRSQTKSVVSTQLDAPSSTAIKEHVTKNDEKLRAQVMRRLEDNTIEIKEAAQIIAYDDADLRASAMVRSLIWKMGEDTVMDIAEFKDELKLRLIIFSENAAVGRGKIEGKGIMEAKAKARRDVEELWKEVEKDIAEEREKMRARVRYLEVQTEDAARNIEVAHKKPRPMGGVLVVGGLDGETHAEVRPMHSVFVVGGMDGETIEEPRANNPVLVVGGMDEESEI
jgi:hypothetical protein